MTCVMAQGTFDVIHPGHIRYLKESSELGDELVVVISRDSRVRERKDRLAFTEDERRIIIDSLEVVDKAILGSKDDIYSTVKRVSPDKITLGHDQDHSVEEVEKLAEKALEREIDVVRIDASTKHSSSEIKANQKRK